VDFISVYEGGHCLGGRGGAGGQKFGSESCFIIWCHDVRLSVALWE